VSLGKVYKKRRSLQCDHQFNCKPVFSVLLFSIIYIQRPGGNSFYTLFTVIPLFKNLKTFKMRFFTVSVLATAVSAHGVVMSVEGANGVSMPGLSSMSYSPSLERSTNTSKSRMELLVIAPATGAALRPTLPSSVTARFAAVKPVPLAGPRAMVPLMLPS
jgi:hypothetical protein